MARRYTAVEEDRYVELERGGTGRLPHEALASRKET